MQHWWVRASTRCYPRFTLAMGSSPGFGPNPCDSVRAGSPRPYYALFRLAFATAPGVTPLTLPQRLTRWVILQKARGQATAWASPGGNALPLFVGIRFQVLFHSGHPGSFHLSLTVLVHYRSPRVFSLGGWAPLLPTGLACPVVLKVTGRSLLTFAYGTITLYGWPFQCHLASKQVCNSFGSLQRPGQALQPPPRNDCSL